MWIFFLNILKLPAVICFCCFKNYYIIILYILFSFFSARFLRPIMLPWTTLQWHSWSGTLVLWEWFVSIGRVLSGSSRHISLWSALSWPWCSLSTFLNGLRGSSWLSFQCMVSWRARHSNRSFGGNFFYSLTFPIVWLDLKKKKKCVYHPK